MLDDNILTLRTFVTHYVLEKHIIHETCTGFTLITNPLFFLSRLVLGRIYYAGEFIVKEKK